MRHTTKTHTYTAYRGRTSVVLACNAPNDQEAMDVLAAHIASTGDLEGNPGLDGVTQILGPPLTAEEMESEGWSPVATGEVP